MARFMQANRLSTTWCSILFDWKALIATYHRAYNASQGAFSRMAKGLLALDIVFVVEALPVLFPVGVVVIVSGFLDMWQIGDFW